ncbi:MAG TPA: ornithine--oxo-acid transaminase [Cyanobacteria bacterium UBA9971]|nr:ornithine--oxo-acid transaminase [Cyanobacteria bacterium UBA9971]
MIKTLSAQDYIELENQYGAKTYSPLDIIIEKGEGVWVFDINGNKYLDCLSAFSCLNTGHCHPKIFEAMVEQAQKLTITSRAFRNQILSLFLKELSELTGKEAVLPMNTGAEAVETAVKLARRWAYQVKGIEKYHAEIIVCENNFHGRTTTITSFSSEPAYKEGFGPFTSGFKIIPYGDAEALRKAITPNTCAFLLEPVQGEAGIIIPPEGYLKEAEKICKENNVLLMFDEIQTGFGRTGKLFAHQHEDVTPDVIIVGKAISGGFYPVSAVLADNSVMDVLTPGSHGSTFGGNPLGCAVARAALKVLKEENLIQNSAELGKYFLDKLKTIDNPHIKEVRGKGLFIAIELDEPARSYCEALQKEGVLCKDTHTYVIRIAPPLIITKDQIDWAFEKFQKVLS